MTTGQFQLESDLLTATRVMPSRRLTPNAVNAGMASVLIGLGLRKWLSDSDKEFLDQLAPYNYISFLMHGREYVHPEGVELFSAEQVESSLYTSGAIFSQQHRMNRLQSRASQVHTAYIGELNGAGITFGIAGPDNAETCTDVGDQFTHLVQQLRMAQADIAPAISRVHAKLHVTSAVLVINRCSGRIIAANEAACGLLQQEERDIVGMEFGQTKLHLTPSMAGSKIVMDNVQIGDISISLLTLQTTPSSVEEILSSVLPNFLQCLRRTSSALQTTSHHLESIISLEPGHPEAELVRILDEEAAELDQTVRRFHLLTEYRQLEKHLVNPAEELRQVINRTATRRPERKLSLYERWDTPVNLQAPIHSLATLYETILQLHFGHTCRCSSTDVAVINDPAGRLHISFTTQAPTIKNAMANRCEWISYCTTLASVMGMQMSHTDGTSIETTLTYVEK